MRNLPDITFQDIGGLELHKQIIYDAIKLPLERAAEYRDKGVVPPKGMIFYGEKGCGKTFLAKAIAKEMKMAFFYVAGPEFRNKYIGSGAEAIRQLFQDARSMAPSIIFIDEVDACLEDRNTHTGNYTSDLVNQMLTEIDGFNPLDSVKVIVATNRYGMLDSTFLDRFPPKYHLEFRLPDGGERLEVLKAITKRQKINGVDLASVAGRTQGANCRALSQICNEAGVYAIKQGSKLILQSHFDMSLKDYIGDPEKYNGCSR